MAKVLVSYSAVMTNSDYIFAYSSGTDGKVRYSAGTSLVLSKSYSERETNGRYPVKSPMNGWVSYQVVGSITPNYEVTTDACTPPSALTINETSKILIITGGTGGDLNTLTGFGISWRERDINSTTWGSWSAEAFTASRSVSVTANAGKVRQYRVRTQGSAGSSYYSGWLECATLLSGNTAAAEPTILLPAAEAVTARSMPTIVVSCSQDNEGDSMTLRRKVDSNGYVDVTTVPGEGGTVYDKLDTLADGRHTITYKVVDSNGAESGESSVSIVVGRAEWSRTIESGDIISNKAISHVADIEELTNAINIQRLYYGLNTISLPGTVGIFADWKRQMEALLEGANGCLAAEGEQLVEMYIPSYPNAAVINKLRMLATGMSDAVVDDSAVLDVGVLDRMVLA